MRIVKSWVRASVALRPGRKTATARPVTARSAGAGLGLRGKRRTPRGGAAHGPGRRATAPQGRDSARRRGGPCQGRAGAERRPRRGGEPPGKARG